MAITADHIMNEKLIDMKDGYVGYLTATANWHYSLVGMSRSPEAPISHYADPDDLVLWTPEAQAKWDEQMTEEQRKKQERQRIEEEKERKYQLELKKRHRREKRNKDLNNIFWRIIICLVGILMFGCLGLWILFGYTCETWFGVVLWWLTTLGVSAGVGALITGRATNVYY